MSEPNFSKIVDGTLSAGAVQIRSATGRFGKHFNTQDLTSAGNGTNRVFGTGRHHYRLSIVGWLYISSAFPRALTSNGNPVSGGLVSQILTANLAKTTPLQDVTGSPDPDGVARFLAQNPIFHGQASGMLQQSEAVFSSDGALSALTIDVGGTNLTGDAVIRALDGQANFRDGGGVPIDFSFNYTGERSSVPDLFNFETFAAEVDLDNGEVVTGTVIPRLVQANLNFRAGAFIPVRIEGPFNGTVGIGEGSSD